MDEKKITLDMEKRKCPLCNTESGRIIYAECGFSLRACVDCSFIYMDPIPTFLALQKIYDDKCDFSDEVMKRAIKGLEDWGRELFYDRVQALKKYKDKGKVLDVGCNFGFFLKMLENAGYEVYGTDISEPVVRYAQKNMGLKVINSTICEAKFPAEYFDIVTMFDVLEHLSDPFSDIAEVYRILKKGGLFLLTVPNSGVHLLKSKIVSLLPFLKYYKGNFTGTPFKANEMGLPYHINHFTPKTIRKMLMKAGFKKIDFDIAKDRKYDGRIIRGCLRKLYGFITRVAFKFFGLYIASELSVCATKE